MCMSYLGTYIPVRWLRRTGLVGESYGTGQMIAPVPNDLSVVLLS